MNIIFEYQGKRINASKNWASPPRRGEKVEVYNLIEQRMQIFEVIDVHYEVGEDSSSTTAIVKVL